MRQKLQVGTLPQADKVEDVIKNQDGKIGSENSYGNGPGKVPGRCGSSRHRAAISVKPGGPAIVNFSPKV